MKLLLRTEFVFESAVQQLDAYDQLKKSVDGGVRADAALDRIAVRGLIIGEKLLVLHPVRNQNREPSVSYHLDYNSNFCQIEHQHLKS